MNFNDPKEFHDPQVFDDPKEEEWTLIIQKSTLIPPSSVVSFLRYLSPFVERFYIYIFNTAWNREMLAHLKNIPSDRQCSPADDPHGNEGR